MCSIAKWHSPSWMSMWVEFRNSLFIVDPKLCTEVFDNGAYHITGAQTAYARIVSIFGWYIMTKQIELI